MNRPIVGWVIDSSGPELSIKLKTGPIVQVPFRDDLRWGDPAFVLYDYERMRVRGVWSYAELVADDEVAEPCVHPLENPLAIDLDDLMGGSFS